MQWIVWPALNFVIFIFRIKSDQDFLFDCEYDVSALGEEYLLDQSDPEKDPMDQGEVVIVEERQPEDPGSLLACGEWDLFDEGDLSDS